MKFKSVLVAGAVAALASSAFANDVITGAVITDGTAGFTITHFDSLDFTDMITFANSSAVFAATSIVTVSLGVGQNIDFTGAMLTGSISGSAPLTLSGPGVFEYGVLTGGVPFSGDLMLTVMGTTDAGGGKNSTYSGTLNVTPVPEPETYALMLAGLGAIGFMARRRRSA